MYEGKRQTKLVYNDEKKQKYKRGALRKTGEDRIWEKKSVK